MAMKALTTPTIYQVAQRAGVSIATVSRALRDPNWSPRRPANGCGPPPGSSTSPPAKAGFPDGPTTWAGLTAMAKAMQTKAGAKWGLSIQPGKTGSWQSVLPFGWSNGAQIAGDDKYTFDTPGLTERSAPS